MIHKIQTHFTKHKDILLDITIQKQNISENTATFHKMCFVEFCGVSFDRQLL